MVIIGSHNSWTFLTPKKWWMKLISFTAKCQDLNISSQYNLGVRCFDLRIRFNNDYSLIVAHGIIEYNITREDILSYLEVLNSRKDIIVRVIHEVRTKRSYSPLRIKQFREFCSYLENNYKNIKFCGGRNLYDWSCDYKFKYIPSIKEIHSSVCSPLWIDDWYPRFFAKRNNKNIVKSEIKENILLIDFVNYKTN